MSKCDEVRELLWPLDAPRAVVEGEAEARAHLEDCTDCASFFKRDAALTRALAVDLVTSTPEGLRARIADALDQEPQLTRHGGLSRRVVPWLAAAAAITIVALGALRSPGRSLDLAYVDAYLIPHPHAAELDAPTSDQAYEFFMAELGTAITPALASTEPVRGARICAIQGQPSAVVDYDLGGHKVAHYRRPARSRSLDEKVHSQTANGVCVVRWSDGQYDHALVADIPEDELIVVAQQQFAALQ